MHREQGMPHISDESYHTHQTRHGTHTKRAMPHNSTSHVKPFKRVMSHISNASWHTYQTSHATQFNEPCQTIQTSHVTHIKRVMSHISNESCHTYITHGSPARIHGGKCIHNDLLCLFCAGVQHELCVREEVREKVKEIKGERETERERERGSSSALFVGVQARAVCVRES